MGNYFNSPAAALASPQTVVLILRVFPKFNRVMIAKVKTP